MWNSFARLFWESIQTNNISEADRDDVKRYEDAQRVAQRHRNAVITTKIVKLGLCIAQAWARNYASTRSRPEDLRATTASLRGHRQRLQDIAES